MKEGVNFLINALIALNTYDRLVGAGLVAMAADASFTGKDEAVVAPALADICILQNQYKKEKSPQRKKFRRRLKV